jgi:hypothetical protein
MTNVSRLGTTAARRKGASGLPLEGEGREALLARPPRLASFAQSRDVAPMAQTPSAPPNQSSGQPNDWRSAARPRGSAATEGLVSCNVRVRLQSVQLSSGRVDVDS